MRTRHRWTGRRYADSLAHYYEQAAGIAGASRPSVRADGLGLLDLSADGTPRAVQPGRYYKFNGTNDYINCNRIRNIDVYGFSFWMYNASSVTNATTHQAIFAGGTNYFGVAIGEVTSLLTSETFVILPGTNGRSGFTTVIPAGWNHICATTDGSAWSIWLNGIAQTVITSAFDNSHRAIPFDSTGLFVGTRQNQSFYYTGGLLDFRLFDATFEASDVPLLMAGKPCSVHPIYWLKCDDDHVATAYNSADGTSHGVKTNITPATFHATRDDTPVSFQNAVGFTVQENHMKWSEELDRTGGNPYDTGAGSSTVLPADVDPPPGLTRAYKVQNLLTGGRLIQFVYAVPAGDFWGGFYIKQGDSPSFYAIWYNGTADSTQASLTNSYTEIDTSTAKVESVGDGWYRVQLKNSAHSAGDELRLYIYPATSGGAVGTYAYVTGFNASRVKDNPYFRTADYSAIGNQPRCEQDYRPSVIGKKAYTFTKTASADWTNAICYSQLITGDASVFYYCRYMSTSKNREYIGIDAEIPTATTNIALAMYTGNNVVLVNGSSQTTQPSQTEDIFEFRVRSGVATVHKNGIKIYTSPTDFSSGFRVSRIAYDTAEYINEVSAGVDLQWTITGGTMNETTFPEVYKSLAQSVSRTALDYKGRVPRDIKFINSNCATFDGIDDYIEFGNRSLSTQSLSATAWVKVTDLSVTRPIISKYSSSTSKRAFALIIGPTGSLTAIISKNGFSGAGASVGAGAPGVVVGEWIHVGFTFDHSTGTLSVYMHGQLAASATDAGVTGVADHSQSVRIGYWESAGAGFMQGSMADVRLYDRSLTASEVAAVFEGGGPSDSTLHCPLAEGDGTTAYDVSPEEEHGSIFGSTPAVFWGSFQDVYHRNIRSGFTERGPNYIHESQAFNSTKWNNSGSGPVAVATANVITAPNGTLTGDRLDFTASASSPFQSRRQHASLGVTIYSGQFYTFSCYFKSISITTSFFLGLDVANPSRWDSPYPAASIVFDPPAATASGSTTAGLELLEDGWFRAWVSCRCKSTFATPQPALFLGGVPSATGAVYVWGAQVNVGTTPTPYLPTFGSAQNFTPLVPTADGSNDMIRLPVENPATGAHNGAETQLDFSSGQLSEFTAAKTVPTDYAFGDGPADDLELEQTATNEFNFVVR